MTQSSTVAVAHYCSFTEGSHEAVANLSYEAEMFLAPKEIATGTPEGSHDQMFFEKVISHGESQQHSPQDLHGTSFGQPTGEAWGFNRTAHKTSMGLLLEPGYNQHGTFMGQPKGDTLACSWRDSAAVLARAS